MKVLAISMRALEDDLLDTIHAMLKRGQLTHAPTDYWEARRKLERRRRDARRRAAR